MSVPGGVMMDALSSASPDQIQRILSLGSTPEQQAMLAQQLAQANALRNTPSPQGKYAGYGGHLYVAPSPLQVIGSDIQKYEGAKQQGDVQTRMTELMGKNALARQDYLNLLRQMAQRSPGGAGPGDMSASSGGGDSSQGPL